MKLKIFAFTAVAFFGGLAQAQNLYYGSLSKEVKKNEFCFYSVAVPQVLAGASASDAQKAAAVKLNAGWKKTFTDFKKEHEAQFADKSECTDLSMSVQDDLNFLITTDLGARLTSVYFTDNFYTGGAHGNQASMSEIFDTQTGESYANLGAFFDDSKLPAIKAAILQGLKTTYPNFDPSFGWAPWEQGITKIGQINNYYITPYGFTFFFDPYAVGPYSDGRYEVLIYFYELANIGAKTTGPATLLPLKPL